MVSILIPTYNRAQFLKECIDSVLAQTIQCEIVVCDHGSTDETPDVVELYKEKIKYIRREKDFGIHFCWLEGILNCSNEFIHINYDDDLIAPAFIEKTLELMKENVGIVFTPAGLFNEWPNITKDLGFLNRYKTGIHNSVHLETYMLFHPLTPVSPGCALMRKKILLDNTFVGNVPMSRYNYRGVGPDTLYTLMSLKEYPKFGFVNESLAFFREHPNSITSDSMSDKIKLKKISSAYSEAKKYYMLSKWAHKLKIIQIIYLSQFLFNSFNYVIMMINFRDKIWSGLSQIFKSNKTYK